MDKPWTLEEEQLLRDKYLASTEEELVKLFGRTWSSLKQRARRFGLNRVSKQHLKEEALALYKEGIPISDISKKLDISYQFIYRMARTIDMPTRRTHIRVDDTEQFKIDYASLLVSELMEKYNTTEKGLRGRACRLGVKRPKDVIPRPKSKFTKELMQKEYVENKMSLAAIAEKYNHKGNLSKYVIRYGLSKTADEINLVKAETNMVRTGYPYPVNCYGKTEKEIRDWLNSFGCNFQTNWQVLNGKQIDMYDESLNLGIEYCGLHFHTENSQTPRLKDYHNNKRLSCEEQGIRLITIFEDEWVRRQEQVKNFLLSVIYKPTIRLYARKCNVKDVELSTARTFIDTYHIQAASPLTTNAFGLYSNDELIGVMSFGRHPADKKTIVLDRLCFKSGISVVGGASKLFKYSLPWLKSQGLEKLISWSDNRWSQGNVYVQLGFELARDGGPDYSYVDTNKNCHRVSKMSQKKSNTKCPEGMTELQWANARGLHRIWDCGKKRWEFNL